MATESQETQSDDRTFPADYVAELRQENASWRKKLRELEAQMATYQTQEKTQQEQKLAQQQEWQKLAEQREQELKTLQAQIRDQNIKQLKMETIQQMGLPSEAIDFLTGDDEETIAAQAKKFKDLIPESEARGQTPRRNMTVIPGGEPTGETREQKMKRLYGNSNIF